MGDKIGGLAECIKIRREGWVLRSDDEGHSEDECNS